MRYIRDISNDRITNEEIERVEKEVINSKEYGPEQVLIKECLSEFPKNTDSKIVAMKIGLIDVTNSTNLARYKSRINIEELSQIITKIENIDERLKLGDPKLVADIAKSNGNINLFSFATKYCCYHNFNIYEGDAYSIYDGILREYLPRYFQCKITKNNIDKWRKCYDYVSYNNYIIENLNKLGITVKNRRRKFDHFVWFLNRKKQ